MSATQRYRDQHDGLLALATEISGSLNVEELTKDASQARALLSQLLGKLTVHLAMEDKSLYPSLLEQGDEQVKKMAQKFSDEMGGIAQAVENYAKTWSSATAIQNDAVTFVDQTKGIFSALADRIDKENNQLYKAYDELKAG